ncbi:MAG: TatD family hydrolase [Candidatus Paceibacterota bacterium]|jgi:TatD DNase family protein
MKYFDIHGHVNFSAYDTDRDEVIQRAEDAGVVMISVGSQLDTSKAAVELANKHENMYAVVGVHPIHTSASHHDKQELGEGSKEFTSRGEQPDLNIYRELAKNPKVVAIGECGLDYYHLDDDSTKKQYQVFESMIDLANEINKPLMLHLRNGSNRSAYKDAYEIVKSRAKVKGNLHFFAGNIEEAKLFLDLGYTFSFTGVVTFARNYDEVIKYLPLDRIMSETDCPYVTPAPYRGKRNEPVYVIEVVKSIAKIRGEDEEVVRQQLFKNASLFVGNQ